jgi:hypothetical protein
MAREHDFFSGLGAANEFGELAFGLGDGYAHDLQSQDSGRAIHSSMVHFNRMRTRGPTRLIPQEPGGISAWAAPFSG